MIASSRGRRSNRAWDRSGGIHPWGGRARVAAALALLTLTIATPTSRADDVDNCLFCHQFRGLSRYDEAADRVHLFFIQPEYVHDRLGPHARLSCTDCHPREEVGVVPHAETSPVDCARTCHLSGAGGAQQLFSHRGVAEMLNESVHSHSTLDALQFSGGPVLEEGQSQCLYCHDEPVFRGPARMGLSGLAATGVAHDRCDACHREQIPVDVPFALRHIASRLQPARSAVETAQVCSLCHADPLVRQAHDLPNSVASYMRSFHGKAALLGDEQTADCTGCHVRRGANVHEMLGPEHPESAVAPVRVADSCRSTDCHPGADKGLANAAVHLDLSVSAGSLEYLVAALFIVLTVFTFGPSMVLCALELLHIVIGSNHHESNGAGAMVRRVLAHPDGRRKLMRFTVSQRAQHWALAILFSMLAVTGFPMKFADAGWARAVVDGLGGLNVTRVIHHWAGLALMLGLGGHLAYVVWTVLRRRRESHERGLVSAITSLPMWVSLDDARKGGHLLAYLLRLTRSKPTFGRFNVKEKFEYIGVFWGTILLGITGVMLWGEQAVSHLFGGRVFNLALIAHTYEAFLAIIHVGILHIVNVMLSPAVFPLSLATITGDTPSGELAEGHDEFVAQAARDLNLADAGGHSHG